MHTPTRDRERGRGRGAATQRLSGLSDEVSNEPPIHVPVDDRALHHAATDAVELALEGLGRGLAAGPVGAAQPVGAGRGGVAVSTTTGNAVEGGPVPL